MREIKFRAWDNYFETMHYAVEHGINQDPDNLLSFSDVLDFAEFNVMQYTGLKDKNGKEIYEGDIVRIYNASNNVERKNWLVEFSWGGFRLTNRNTITDDKMYLDNDSCIWCEYEVIGNIYENPELLEVTE